MIAASKEVSGTAAPPLRALPTRAPADGAFGALVASARPPIEAVAAGARAARGGGAITPLSSALPPSDEGAGVAPAPDDSARADPSLVEGAVASHEEERAAASEAAPAVAVSPAPPASQNAAPSCDLASAASTGDSPGVAPAKRELRKPGSAAAEKRAEPSGDARDGPSPVGAVQAFALLQPLVSPLGRPAAGGTDAAEQTGTGETAAPTRAAPTAAPSSDAGAPTGDAAAPPDASFGALIAPPPPSGPATPRAKPGVAAPGERSAPSVAGGDSVGLQIARHITAGTDSVSVALTPDSLGRVEVRMRFDDSGTLRAVVSASTPEALALLHRDSALLDQAMAAAGVRTDAQSFAFDSRANGGDARHPHADARAAPDPAQHVPDSAEAAVTQPLRSSGTLDLLA